MITELEFLNGVGSEGVASNIQAYDGQVPCIGDLVYLERNGNGEPFRVVDRVFHLTGPQPDSTQKISFHCVPFDKERDSFSR